MADNADTSVSAGEIVRSFAKWSDRALESPVFISRHGRRTHALLGMARYEAMLASGDDDGEALGYQEVTDFINDGLVVIDHDEAIVYANPYARAWCRFPETWAGMRLAEALPAMEGSPALAQMRRTKATRMPLAADLPSVFVKDRWINCQTIPVRDKVAMLFRDITDDVQSHRLADMKKAMVEAISLHKKVGYIRINQRGMIERTDASISDWIGLSQDRLIGVRLLDLIDVSHRAAMSETLESVLSSGESSRCHSRFVPNREGTVALDCAIVPLKGAYGAEGAVLVFTPQEVSDTGKAVYA